MKAKSIKITSIFLSLVMIFSVFSGVSLTAYAQTQAIRIAFGTKYTKTIENSGETHTYYYINDSKDESMRVKVSISSNKPIVMKIGNKNYYTDSNNNYTGTFLSLPNKTTKFEIMLNTDKNGKSANFKYSVTFSDVTPTEKIAATMVTNDNVKFFWYKYNGADGYQCEFSFKNDMSNGQKKETEKTNCSIKVSPEEIIYFRVRAYKIGANNKYYFKWSNIASVNLIHTSDNSKSGEKTLVKKINVTFTSQSSYANYDVPTSKSTDKLYLFEYTSTNYPIQIAFPDLKESHHGTNGDITLYAAMDKAANPITVNVAPYTDSELTFKNTDCEINIYDITPMSDITYYRRDNSYINLAWKEANKESDVEGYIVQWSETADFKTYKQQDYGKNAKNGTVSGLNINKGYYIRVVPYNYLSVNNRQKLYKYVPSSAQYIAPIINKVNVKATSIKKLSKGKKSFKAVWKSIGGVNGYQLQYSTKKNMKGAKSVNVNGAKTTIKKLKKNKKYYVRVRAYKVVNGKKYYSNWSKIKSVKTK